MSGPGYFGPPSESQRLRHEAALDKRRISELKAENARLNARLAYLTVDCDEYVYKGGRCYRYEQDTICPREPRCHDKDRWAEMVTP